MRVLSAVLLIAGVLASPSNAQTAIGRGTPSAAFAGSPIHLAPAMEARLQAQFHGDNVPIVPSPFGRRLDAALLARDWRQIEALKKALIAERDLLPVLLWDQTRFIITGEVALAASYARDLAGSDVPAAEDNAATIWLYAVAATFTDGHKCIDPAARDTYLATLLGSDFDAVKGIVRFMPEDRLAVAREAAIKLEAGLSGDRSDDAMCRAAGGRAGVRPNSEWKAELAPTRTMLPRHLAAICAVVRKKPQAQR